jgi:anhydro-N-acetylmuramic acid kinase
MKKEEILCMGTMSGTSLDGLDLALCSFLKNEDTWNYSVIKTETFEYSKEWKNKLSNAENLSGLDLMFLHNEFGNYTAEKINLFLKDIKEKPQFIASHGHTVFHQPQKGLTLQIGNGANIAAKTGITTICDFRTTDVALGGNGAPLVPIGDKLLFSKFDYCLNLGGFANISFDNENNTRIAFDICPVNILLNKIVSPLGLEYDNQGEIAQKGKIQPEMLYELNQLPFYQSHGPKSLGKEWLLTEVLPITGKYSISIEDKLRTVTEHIAIMITNAQTPYKAGPILVTGGGAFNKFLITRLKELIKNELYIPDNQTINYKEALIFAFLGLLRFFNQKNCLSSVTGAAIDNTGGAVYCS